MASESLSNLQKQLTQISSKVDRLDKQIELIIQDLNVNRGVKVFMQLDEITNHIKGISRDLNEGHLSSIKFKLDELARTVESVNKRIAA
jgi:archaellum component FlaC